MKKLFMISVFLLIIPLVIGSSAAAEAPGVEDGLIKGVNLFYNGEYQKAIEVFSSIQKDLSDNKLYVDTLYYQTLSYIKEVDVTKAKDNIEKLKEEGYEFGLIYWRLGEIYLNKNGSFDSPFYNEAKKQLEKASMLGIDSPSFHSDLGNAYQGLGLIEKAIKEYEFALSENNLASDYINLANLYKKVDKFDQALKYYRKSLELEDGSISIYSNIADILTTKGKIDQAITILEKGIEKNDNYFAIYFQLGKAYFVKEEYKQAESEFEKVIEINNNNYKSYYYLAKIHTKNENFSKAVYYYKQALKYNPNYADAYIELGDLYLDKGENYKAISQYSSAVQSNPNYPEGHFHLAKAFMKRDMRNAAISELKETLHLEPDHKEAQKLLDELTEE